MSRAAAVVCFGEILWDVFPDKKVIGGAPFNVALRLHSLGYEVSMISKIGEDEDGEKVMEYVNRLNFPVHGIQQTPTLKTGTVLVSVDAKGTATYVITEPVAWDDIEATPEAVQLVENAQVFVFGSIVCRSPKSKETLFQLLKHAAFSVFDVNVRPPFYTLSLLIDLMRQSHFVKMNDEELETICIEMKSPFTSLEENIKWLKDIMELKGICVTKGAHGAVLLWENEWHSHGGFRVPVADTVGAGDSFLATLVGGLWISKLPAQQVLEKACAVGALVASKQGANCEVTQNEIAALYAAHKK